MDATHYLLHVPPRPWLTIGLDYLTHLLVSNGFDGVLIAIDHLTRMAHFICRVHRALLPKKLLLCFYMESTDNKDCPACLSVTATRNSPVASGIHFGDALERVWICLPVDTQRQTDGRSETTTHFSSFFVASVISTQLIGQTCYLRWNLRTTLLVHSKLSTLPLSLTLGSVLRSPLICSSARDLLSHFRKTRQNG
jgi:hypothetical protein